MSHKHNFRTEFSTYRHICVSCGQVFKDMDTYIYALCNNMKVDSVMDVGTGLKGVVADYFWRTQKSIKRGWAVDAWKIKPSNFWIPINDNALNLPKHFNPKSVDVVQAFGFLEHLKKNDGYTFLRIAEKIAKKAVILSAATEVHGPTRDYKVKMDGNPYHYYWSTWKWNEFERLGYQSSYQDMLKGLTYSKEAIAWKTL